ncbi:MAG: hypothetical protein HOK24_04470 [Desulfobacula sp.]|jgi:fructokinase|uniref:PfkB family carbohydrate kinase n=1 Tax=Desulfobacula sp. TaxID=2593537 RepID=UPI001DFC116C|nr:hypothetical protein [Desulfobacula sp.]MBT4024109.1 hypothetical protein [Desulfobacula sp.]MBT4197433.1 hypothetical protein [Desulfobacula sp.]MBT4505704.1 hypothetical protein [Desulfobacula sp.]MBT4875217.1 hypothetical protein [Desulfobacula sp.]
MFLIIGEILFDIFPNGKRIGGAPFNFAFHLKKLGFPVRFVSRVGSDQNGEEILTFLADHGFDTQDIQIDADHGTGIVEVETFKGTGHRFIIVPDKAYDYIDFDIIPEQYFYPDLIMIYFGSLIQRRKTSAERFHEMMNQKPQHTSTFCDLNLRPDCYNRQSIKDALLMADTLKINQDEFDEISSWFLTDGSLEYRTVQLMDLYHIKTVILTMGDQASHWFHHHHHHEKPILKIQHVVDTVGAGDAYAAICAAGITNRLPVEKTTALAVQFASHICQSRGALPDDLSIYQPLAKKLGMK